MEPAEPTPAPTSPWVPAGHFYSPLTSAAELVGDAERIFGPARATLPAIDLDLPGQVALLQRLLAYYGEEGFPARAAPDRRYWYENEYFGYGDAFMLHALLRHTRPRRIIEVGSGYSTAVMLDTDERFLGGALRLTLIEPRPERVLSLFRPGDRERVRLLPHRVQELDPALFDELQENDVLFIDSSHVCKTGSDVNHLFFEILPRLRPGVRVHVHDIQYNFEYPRTWAMEGRSWNEAYLLRAFLMHNTAWRIELYGSLLAQLHPHELQRAMPLCAMNPGGSLWLRRC